MEPDDEQPGQIPGSGDRGLQPGQPPISGAPSTSQPADDLSSMQQGDVNALGASGTNLLAQSEGIPSAPSGTPGMLGDFFGPGCTMVAIAPILGSQRTITFTYTGMTLPDESVCAVISPQGPVQSIPPDGSNVLSFTVCGQTLSGVTLPNSQFVSTGPQGTGFGLTPGDAPYQQGLRDLTIGQQGPGVATPTGGHAEPSSQQSTSGSYDITQFVTYQPYLLQNPISICVPLPSGGGEVGRVKLAENNSPIPRDRVFNTYSHFDNVAFGNRDENVNRFVPGFEKTFFDRMMSIEMRFPFASTLNSRIVADGMTSDDRVQFGNASMIWKTLLHVGQESLYTGGLQITAPTGDDVNVYLVNGTKLLKVRNSGVHVGPFLGFLTVPTERMFIQGFWQLDLAASGDPVFINQLSGAGLQGAGVLTDGALSFADLNFGYWAYRNSSPWAGLTGIAPMFEIHYNRSLQSSDAVRTGAFQVGQVARNFEQLNLVVGATLLFQRSTSVSVGFAAPVTGGADKNFDGEFRLLFNHYFGASASLPPSQL